MKKKKKKKKTFDIDAALGETNIENETPNIQTVEPPSEPKSDSKAEDDQGDADVDLDLDFTKKKKKKKKPFSADDLDAAEAKEGGRFFV